MAYSGRFSVAFHKHKKNNETEENVIKILSDFLLLIYHAANGGTVRDAETQKVKK